jgi:hypothetical protein
MSVRRPLSSPPDTTLREFSPTGRNDGNIALIWVGETYHSGHSATTFPPENEFQIRTDTPFKVVGRGAAEVVAADAAKPVP